jgi:hypothetical protein
MKDRNQRHARERVSFHPPLSPHTFEPVDFDTSTKSGLYDLKNQLVKEGK